jgi:uncharacterized protein (TIGR00661 family)
MNFSFIIQGEGRGHMTQAMALQDFLKEKNHGLSEVFIGRSRQREIPSFVYSHFSGKIRTFHSPNFIRKRNRKGINVLLSFIYNLFLAPFFIFEIFRLALRIRKSDADIIINFYDLIGGLAHFFSFSRKKLIVISHHFYYLHPSAVKLSGHHLNKLFLRWHSKLTSIKAEKRIGLSFQFLEDHLQSSLYISPPLLRKEILNKKVIKGENVVAYLLHEGFLEDIIDLAGMNPDINFEVFTELRNIKRPMPGNILLKAPDESFLNSLASCRGLICTAGFESVCEAAYLGKPVLVWPSEGHFEQKLNAMDAINAGLAETPDESDINTIFSFPVNNNSKSFREWFNKKDTILENILFDQ